MFLPNKYTKWYNNIIYKALSRNLDGYTEKHHIIPKSLGGTNDKSNLVILTAREHFVCHLLLTKMVTGNFKHKMLCAANRMLTHSKNHNRYKPTSHVYQYLKEQFSKQQSILSSSMIRSPESNTKRSVTLKGRKQPTRTDQHKLNLSNSLKGNIPWNKGKTTPQKGMTYEEIYGTERAKELKALRSSSLKGKAKSDNAKAIWSKNRSGIVSAYDLINCKTVKISKAEFDLYRNVKYVGLRSPLIPKD